MRAARDFCDKEPKFAATVAMLALMHLLAGRGYEPRVSEADDAIRHLMAASRRIDTVDWALQELRKLAAGPVAAGRELFRQAVVSAVSRHEAGCPGV